MLERQLERGLDAHAAAKATLCYRLLARHT